MSLAAKWDLCISGDGLHHLHQIGAETDYIPLTQVLIQAGLPESYMLLAHTPETSRGARNLKARPAFPLQASVMCHDNAAVVNDTLPSMLR